MEAMLVPCLICATSNRPMRVKKRPLLYIQRPTSPFNVSLWSEALWRVTWAVIGHSQLVCSVRPPVITTTLMLMHHQLKPILGQPAMDCKKMVIAFSGWMGGFIGSATVTTRQNEPVSTKPQRVLIKNKNKNPTKPNQKKKAKQNTKK